MKVAQIVSTFPPYHGGIGNAAYHISWELSRIGNDVTVFTLAAKGSAEVDAGLPFKVRRLRPVAWYGNAGFVPQLLWLLQQYDIVHLHYPFFGGSEILYFRDRMLPLNIILHYHMDVVGEGVAQKFFSWHSEVIMPRILDRANQIIVTSMDYARQSRIAEYLQANSSKFCEIPLGVNPGIFKSRIKSKELLTRYGLTNKLVILFVGGLDRAHYFKGVNYLIKAFQLISSNDNYRLIIVGSGSLKKSYEGLAHNFGLEKKIIFAGSVTDDLLPLYYNLADVSVLPSIDSSEAFGLMVLESMASGTPVVATDLPGVRSVIVKDETGILCKPKNVTSLARSLRYLLENPQIRNRFGQASRARILKYYTWTVIGKQLQALYEERRT